MNPSYAVAAATFRVAVAVFPVPIDTWLTVPIVTPPVENTRGPVNVPGVVAVTTALSVTAPPRATVVGVAVTVVVVAAIPAALTVTVTAELADAAYVVFDGVNVAVIVCVPAEGKPLGSAKDAVNGAVAEIGSPAAGSFAGRLPSTKKMTVPAGAVLSVFGATVAVKVTASFVLTVVAGVMASVVVVPTAATSA